MLGNDILMSRALRYAVDKHNLTMDALANLNGDLKTQLQDLSIEIESFVINHSGYSFTIPLRTAEPPEIISPSKRPTSVLIKFLSIENKHPMAQKEL